MNFPILKDMAKMRMFEDITDENGEIHLAMDAVSFLLELDSDCIHKMIQLY